MLKESTRKNTNPVYFFVAVTMLRLELLNIAEVTVYPATHYVQTTTNIILYGSASLQYVTDFGILMWYGGGYYFFWYYLHKQNLFTCHCISIV